jgi:hypothetical protein
MVTSVSEEPTASIFREENLFFYLKELEAASFSEMLVTIYQTTRCHISEDMIVTEAYNVYK